jgi:hypothetical protein
MMKQVLVIATLLSSLNTIAQTTIDKQHGVNLVNRDNDHLVIQIGSLQWLNRPDSIGSKGFSRTINVHLFKDFIFKTDNRFSVAIGLGVGTDHFFLDNRNVDLSKTNSSQLNFPKQGNITYKKSKLATTYLEAPVELRFAANPLNYANSLKIGIGAKVGTLVDAHSKRKKAVQNGNEVNLPTLKEKERSFFSSTRIAATLRIGYGYFGVFATYQVNSYIKDENNFTIRPFSVGICLSGL